MSETFDREAFVFELPEDRIAQHPSHQRELSKLLIAEGQAPLRHHVFHEIESILRPGDVLVLNQTKVMNARCFALKDNGVRIQVFVTTLQSDPTRVPVMFRPAKRVKEGMSLQFPNAQCTTTVVEKGDQGRGTVDFGSLDNLIAVLEKDGELPLPPYIKRDSGPGEDDLTRYQTVFAKNLGAVAAPTAGLHFSEALLEKLEAKGVQLARVTHHVGLGTFKPLLADDIRDHEMEVEQYEIDEVTANALNAAKADGRRIIAVGTTSTRCLESNFCGEFRPGKNGTGLYIYPGYEFNAIDGLVTNFHLPGSTLILLVSALMGKDKIMDIYQQAIAKDYRFYSYGDAMLLLPD